MGRSSYSSKTEVDWLKKIKISFLKKHDYLNHGWRSGSLTWSSNGEQTGNISIQSYVYEDKQYVQLIYTQTDHDTGEKKDFNYKIPLITTPCYFGNKRYWFICPLSVNGKYCGKRVGVLYKAGDYFGCRNCQKLNYSSQKENRRNKHFALFSMLNGYDKIHKLEQQIKRKSYAGKPTKKQMRLDRIGWRMVQMIPLVKSL